MKNFAQTTNDRAAAAMINPGMRRRHDFRESLKRLTPNERRVLDFLAETAAIEGIEPKTVSSGKHVGRWDSRGLLYADLAGYGVPLEAIDGIFERFQQEGWVYVFRDGIPKNMNPSTSCGASIEYHKGTEKCIVVNVREYVLAECAKPTDDDEIDEDDLCISALCPYYFGRKIYDYEWM